MIEHRAATGPFCRAGLERATRGVESPASINVHRAAFKSVVAVRQREVVEREVAEDVNNRVDPPPSRVAFAELAILTLTSMVRAVRNVMSSRTSMHAPS